VIAMPDPSHTFADLGLDFPLYLAPVQTCSDYQGAGRCAVCNTYCEHVFRLGVGGGLVRVVDGHPQAVEWDDEAAACYSCLRGGKAYMTQDTELGMVSLEQAVEGWTHGTPLPARPEWAEQGIEIGEPNENGWRRYRCNPSDLLELTRTPTYLTWQGERWPLHCGRVMPYIGEWKQSDFENESDNGGFSLFKKIIGDQAEEIWPAVGGSVICYAHRCRSCNQVRCYWDCD